MYSTATCHVSTLNSNAQATSILSNKADVIMVVSKARPQNKKGKKSKRFTKEPDLSATHAFLQLLICHVTVNSLKLLIISFWTMAL